MSVARANFFSFQDILGQNASPAMNVAPVVLKEWNLTLNIPDFLSHLRPDVNICLKIQIYF